MRFYFHARARLRNETDVLLAALALQARERASPSPVLFSLDKFGEPETLANFRFSKAEIHQLVAAFRLPTVIRTNNKLKVSGVEALCILLRRLSYPGRLEDLIPMFGRTESQLSRIVAHMVDYIYDRFSHLLEFDEQRLTHAKLQEFAQAIAAKGGVVPGCFGFIDGTLRGTCKPIYGQKQMFNGHKRTHGLKFQLVTAPDGMIVHLSGPWVGCCNDARMLRESNLNSLLADHCSTADGRYVLYGDSGYPQQTYIRTPYRVGQLTPAHESFNSAMSRVRQTVEWGFRDIVTTFAFLDFKKNLKVLLQPVGKLYFVGAILTNVYTCMHGNNTASYFMLDPPTLDEYLHL